MDTNFFAPRYIKFFVIDPAGKDSLLAVERTIMKWVNETGALILDLQLKLPRFAREQILVAITYAISEKETPADVKASTGEVKVPVKGRAPAMDMIKKEGDTRTRVRLMAGAFPAEEGGKMHPDDQEPAPLPLLAESCDLKKYGNLFCNIGGSNAGPTSPSGPASPSASCGAGSPKQ